MSKRAPSFDFGMPQERPQEPHRRLPEAHRCQAPSCTAIALYGFREPGIAALRKPVRVWACSVHRNLYP